MKIESLNLYYHKKLYQFILDLFQHGPKRHHKNNLSKQNEYFNTVKDHVLWNFPKAKYFPFELRIKTFFHWYLLFSSQHSWERSLLPPNQQKPLLLVEKKKKSFYINQLNCCESHGSDVTKHAFLSNTKITIKHWHIFPHQMLLVFPKQHIHTRPHESTAALFMYIIIEWQSLVTTI